MKFLGLDIRRSAPAAETRGITITQNASREELLAFFGLNPAALPAVSVNSALRVPAVNSAVNFLSRTMASLPFEGFRETADGPQPLAGRLQIIVRDAPNPEWSSFAARKYFWTQVFLHGRGLFAILRQNGQPYELWPMNVTATRVSMDAFGQKTYTVTTSSTQPITKSFPAADVIDVPFMLADDMVNVLSPIRLGEKAIQLALAMNDYGSQFFAGGGVPPLALEGQLANNADAQRRALGDVHRAIEAARQSDKPIFPMPPGYKLNQVGYDPAKGQMTDARRLQIEEIARVWQLPPVFVQDLTHGTLNNTEQSDLFVVKHNITHWCTALEQEANLKLFGQLKGNRYVMHDVDAMLRGDFLSRMTGLGKAVQGGILTPQEGRRKEGLPDHPNPAANELYLQSGTAPIGTVTTPASIAPPAPDNGDTGNADPNA